MRLTTLATKLDAGAYMQPYISWLPEISPDFTWTWDHVIYIADHIQRVLDGKINKLMIFMPPRHAKTETVTLRLPVYCLERQPRFRIILGSYNQTQANRFSSRVRALARTRNININPIRNLQNDWETIEGGGVRAVGVGAGVQGVGGDLIILDDPVRGRKDASSLTIRNSIYNWYRDDIFTRREKGASIILINTRWHEDDLAGRILSLEGERTADNPNGWVVLSLPALAKDNDPLGRKPGQALCPERFDERELLEIKAVMGRGFEALYQQSPVEQEGGLFKRTWLKFENSLPEGTYQYCRYWDKAATEDGDYTVGALLARNTVTKNIYVLDIVRGQWTPSKRDTVMLNTAEHDREMYGHVSIIHEQEPGASGIDSAQATAKLLQGYSVRAIPSRTNKQLRAEPFAAQCEAGNVYLIKASWNFTLIDELCSFPYGANDDQVDCVAGAFNALMKGLNATIIVGKGYAKR